MNERRVLTLFALFISITFVLFDLFLNYRMYHLNKSNEGLLLSENLTGFVIILISVFGYFSYHSTIYLLKAGVWMFLILFTADAPFNPDKRISRNQKLLTVLLTILFFLSSFLSPFEGKFTSWVNGVSFNFYIIFLLTVYVALIYFYNEIGKTIQLFKIGGADNEKASVKNDPLGRYKRVFPQQTKKIENKYSFNIPYLFLTAEGYVKGWINVINPFRGTLVMGTPGSGKSYGTFLPAIHQFIMKGFTMLLYDFKFKDLTEYAYHCYLEMVEKADKKKSFFYNKILPQFCIFSLEQPLYSERCNVFQPHIMKDFVVDALGLIKAFFIALNPSWKNKEGDFFPESAINIAAAGTWGLNLYQPKDGRAKGSMCSLPHLIEFMSQDVESIVGMLIKLKDGSLVNVIKPFEEAMRDGALEQLQGQMGTVRITLSRLTSPKLYYMLTEEQGTEPFDLVINSKEKPKIMALANSGQNQGVNNIILSLFLVQISRFINKKGQLPCAVLADEYTTLSTPKGTIDTLIATGRGHLIAVMLGIQDKVQMIRDMGKDVADAMINMIGNYFSGSVRRETAKFFSEEIGDIRIVEKNTSVSANGEVSYSFSEKEIRAVPPSFISAMSQGTMVGLLSDDIAQKNDKKAFYGEIQFDHPFKVKEKKVVEVFEDGEEKMIEREILVDKVMPQLPYSAYWTRVVKENCEGMVDKEKEEFVQKLMDINFRQVVLDVAMMKADLLGVPFNEEEVMSDAIDRMAGGRQVDQKAAEEDRRRQAQIDKEEEEALLNDGNIPEPESSFN